MSSSGNTAQQDKAESDRGIGIISFLTALGVALAIFAAQAGIFLLLRNKLARIFKPKTYLVPERERTDPPPNSPIGLVRHLFKFSDREVIKKCGLDAYFFLRYLKTLMLIFVPIVCIVLPILIPLNYIDGKGKKINVNEDDDDAKGGAVVGLDTLAWGNVKPIHASRYTAHLLMAILVIVWVCAVFFFELRVYIKVRQDHLTSAEHRLRASATTVLVSSIPPKWLSEEGLRGLFDVFPGGIRNLWLNRDLTSLLDKVNRRDKIHLMLESAETELIRSAKKAHTKMLKKQEKQERKQKKQKAMTKQERNERAAEEDANAQRRAAETSGTTAGAHEEVPHTIGEGVDESKHLDESAVPPEETRKKGFKVPLLGNPLSKVTHGVQDVIGAVEKTGRGVDKELETTNGFLNMNSANGKASIETDRPSTAGEAIHRRSAAETIKPLRSDSRAESVATDGSGPAYEKETGASAHKNGVNTVRKLDNINDMYKDDDVKFWQFWKEPPGGYASPVPQSSESKDYFQQRAKEHSFLNQLKHFIPFMGGSDVEDLEYGTYHNADYTEEMDAEGEWAKYLKKKKRPTHRLPLFGVMALPGLPFITKKVDTIYYCRAELARLNHEIEEDQKHPERYPLMNSAFIQFEHQVAAHMACQSVIHHIPRHMAPRVVEVSPTDVEWDNMAYSWWEEWARSGIVIVIVVAMIILWAIPVAATAGLSQLGEIINDVDALKGLRDNKEVAALIKAVAGVLPAAVLAILLVLVPLILGWLAQWKGVKTGAQKTEFIQLFYFAFLFVQVFLVVSVSSFITASIDTFVDNIKDLSNVGNVLNILAKNLPKASNYFFSYMMLQAMSVSSGTLLQVGALFFWYIVARLIDSTARDKWQRNTKLEEVRWGKFFPVYTNFACIGLIYCVVAPLISIFAVLTFGLLWVAHRYAMLYVIRFENDTGGVLYPRAINQTFTGLYFMEACLAGLFFIVPHDKTGRAGACKVHGIIMIIMLLLTILYQVGLNYSFGPLFRYLPITFEDEAVLRDEAFQRAQARRFGLEEEAVDEWDAVDGPNSPRSPKSPIHHNSDDIELGPVRKNNTFLRNPVKQVGTWAASGGKQIGHWAKDGGNELKKLRPRGDSQAAQYRAAQRKKDLEAQRAIGDALYGGFHDEIEDLTPEERDWMVRSAFTHSALRARRPVVWIPHDDIGVSDDEIRRTKEFSDHIWISNEGTALDSKTRVVYGKNPPDFSEVDLINL